MPPIEISKRGVLQIILLVFLAVAHRTIIVAWTPVIAADGAFYLQAAKDFEAGNVQLALEDSRLHPVHMVLTTTFHTALGSFEAAAYFISILAGGLTVIPLFVLVRMLWNERVALGTSILYTFHPTLSLQGSEVLNTGLYLCLLVSSVACIVMALADRNWLFYPVGGLLAALTYLTRPEGLILIPMASVAVVAAIVIRLRRRRPILNDDRAEATSWQSWLRIIGGIVTAVSVFVLFAFPYLIWLRRSTGSWCLTSRGSGYRAIKSLKEDLVAQEGPARDPAPKAVPSTQPATATAPAVPALTQGPVPPSPASATGPAQPRLEKTERAPASPPLADAPESGGLKFKMAVLNTLQRKYVGAYFAPLFPFAVIGLAVCRRQGGRWLRLAPLWGMTVLNLGAVGGTAWLVTGFHFSERYFSPGILFLLPWAAAGLLAVTGWIDRMLQKRTRPRISRIVSAVPCVVLLALAALKTVGPRRAEQVVFLEAGAWLRQHGSSLSRNVLSSTEKIPYYGGFRACAAPEGVSGVRWYYRNHWFERADNAAVQDSVSDQVRQTLNAYKRINSAFLVIEEGRSLHHHPAEFPAELERVGFRPVASFDNGLPKLRRTVNIYHLEE